ncbi:MAG: hypothetical protein IT531_18800 [Burkholderiales bacterium]|nr:hypothetical protein [Burkholderiales bacterium]
MRSSSCAGQSGETLGLHAVDGERIFHRAAVEDHIILFADPNFGTLSERANSTIGRQVARRAFSQLAVTSLRGLRNELH